MTEAPPEPAFVLVRPQMGENIGAAARAMSNFGLCRLRLVAPRDGWPNPRAVAMASGAGRLLDAAMLCDDLGAAVDDCHLVLATTARVRGLAKDVLSPEQAMTLVRERLTGGDRVAVLFGPERAGLENEDVARATAIVSFPVDAALPSLNLAQCVGLMAYEWRRSGQAAPRADAAARADPVPPAESSRPATMGEIRALADHWETRLDAAGFFFPPAKAAHMKLTLRNLWSRLALTRSDIQILHGALRQLVRRPPP